MRAVTRAIALLGALCVLASARSVTPEQACKFAGNRRKALSATKFVSCLDGAPWEVLDCPTAWSGRQLRFSERLQTCTQ